MSTTVMGKAWPITVTPVQKLVLISLADQANDDGICWPGVASMAKRTCLSERSVQRALRELSHLGLLTITLRPGRSTVYRVTAGGVTESPPSQSHHRGVSQSHPRGVTESPGGCHSVTQTIIEPSTNRQSSKANGVALPDWLPAEPWKAYVEMRQRIRAPLTDKGKVLILAKLEKLAKEGHPPEQVLEQSIENSYRGVFAIKGSTNAQAAKPKSSIGRDLSRKFLEVPD
jgi:hypothetical protein